MPTLKDVDPEIATLLRQETRRQRNTISLIASENYASRATLEAQGSILANKHGQGAVGDRGSGGCRYVDAIETCAIERAKRLFGAEHANVQAATASIGNLAVLHALLQPGDTVLAMQREHGGHSTHGGATNLSGRIYRFVFYSLDPRTEQLDYDAIRARALETKPRLLIAGATNYSRLIDFATFRQIANEVGAFLMVDMAHIVGLIIAGLHPNPVPHAHVVTTSTHKTLRGPRGGGLILCTQDLARRIDEAVSPGLQAAPMLDVIASRAVLFREAATPQFRAYQVQVLRNAKTLSDTLLAEGFRIVSGGTDTHLMLLDLTPTPVRGEAGQAILESVGIIVSKARIPFDESGGSPCGGLRLGTPAITTRGMKESGVRQIAGILKAVLRSSGDASVLKQARSEVTRLARALPLFSPEWDAPVEQGGAPGLEPRTLVADDASDASRLVGGEGLGYV